MRETRKALAILARGSITAAAAGIVALLLVAFAFHKSWYLSALLPLEAAFYLMLAWFLYLRDDGLARKAGTRAEGTRRARTILLVAAAELLLAATALYALLGIGASYLP